MGEKQVAEDADWITSMFDMQADLSKRAVNEVNRLRRRVRELELELASGVAAQMTELQDRITTLELQLAQAKATTQGGNHG